jgi:hypothetical protein
MNLLVPSNAQLIQSSIVFYDRHCGLVVRVTGYRSKGPRFDSRSYQIF